MKIQVVLTSVLKDAAGNERLVYDITEGTTVKDVLLELKSRFPAMGEELFDQDGRLEPHIFVAVNDAQVSRDGSLDRELQEGDEVALMVSFAGG